MKHWKSKGTKPKGTGQKGPAKRDQPKGTKTQKGPWPKGTMAKRDQGTKGTMAKRDQGTKGTKGQKGPRHKRDHGLFKILIIEIQIIGIRPLCINKKNYLSNSNSNTSKSYL